MTRSQIPRYAVAFLAGTYSLFSMPSLDMASVLLGALLCVLLLLVRLKKWRLPGLFFVAGFFLAAISVSQQLENSIPQEMAGKIITVEGRIEGLPEREGRLVRFNLNVFRSDKVNGMQIKGRIRVSDYRRQAIDPQPGEAWKLLLRIKPAHGFANPAGFDYEKWLFNHKIIATAYIRKSRAGDSKAGRVNHRLPDLDVPAYIDHIRLAIAKQINISLGESPVRGIITALATGDRRAISTHQWRVLQKTGTSHLMAISGLHVGMVAGIAFFIFRLFCCSIPGLALRFPAHKAAVLAALVFALFYSLLAGFSLPTQRALLMLTVLSLSVITDRNVRPLDILSLSLLLVLIMDPLAVLSAGFWLSFSAVAMILYAVLLRRHGQSWTTKTATKAIRLQWKLSLMMAPLSLIFFQQIPLGGPVANIVAIPAVALLIVPLVLLASISFLMAGNGFIEQSLYQLADVILQYLWEFLELMTAATELLRFSPDLSAPALAGLLFSLLILLLPAGLQARKLVVIGLLAFFYPLHAETPDGEFRMILLDVGQGLSAIIKTGRHTLLFDTGARFSEKFNAGDAVVLPVLKSLSIYQLDKLLISHGDNDHSGGSEAILSGMKVAQVLTNEKFTREKNSDYTVAPCVAGEQWTWEGVSFKILHPTGVTAESGNNASCVLKVQSKYGSLLLPADIEKEAEQEIISRYPGEIDSSILIAPHHGSRTSSSDAFLDAVSPQLVLTPAGWMNRYRHPSKAVLSRYADRGLRQISTADCGAIYAMFDRRGVTVESFRQENRKIWDRSKSDANCLNLTIGLPENPDI